MVQYIDTNVYSIMKDNRIYNIFDVINDCEYKESYGLGNLGFIKVDIPIPNKLCTLKNNYRISDEVFVEFYFFKKNAERNPDLDSINVHNLLGVVSFSIRVTNPSRANGIYETKKSRFSEKLILNECIFYFPS